MAVNFPKSSLSPARRRLVETIQRLHFGQIQNLQIRGGDPVFDPPPQIIRDIKLASEPAPHPASGRDDFLLKEQVVELFRLFDRLRDGVVDSILVMHGLPFRVQYLEPPA